LSANFVPPAAKVQFSVFSGQDKAVWSKQAARYTQLKEVAQEARRIARIILVFGGFIGCAFLTPDSSQRHPVHCELAD
jgi:hypothetical protein